MIFMTKTELKKVLKRATNCTVQHNGWTCGTCFFAMSDNLNNQDWQAVLLFRGDYKKEDLNNLPQSIENSLIKTMSIARGVAKI